MNALTAKNSVPEWLRMKLLRAPPDDILKAFGVSAPPVDPFAIVRRLGIQVEVRKNCAYSGIVESSREGATIIVHDGEVQWRQRFTVAHELGHLMLHPLGQKFRDKTFSGDQQERDANAFAASLLMPLWMLEPYALKFGADSVRIAAIFGVSEQAMNIRLGNLVGRL